MSLVKIENVSKSYGSHIVLSDLNLTLEKGKIIGLLGSNGSGKTTIIKLINGLLQQNSGRILVNGIAPGVESAKILSYLPERTYLDESYNVIECVELFVDFYEDFNKEKCLHMLRTMKVDVNDKIKELSKGTREKVQLALVMSRQAMLYILDEPLGGVDPASRDFILDMIIQNFDNEASMLICTHLIADIENILDEVIFISEGKILTHDSADELRIKHGKSIDKIFREEFRYVD
ncbi:ABC transporter ATP-binding protein [Mycoplasma sp. P36-A1]|uniref:ABC transporter ATP-binding protein n=1 Tax=Mycoplasma sp. P36-A1 TaxID=3252900 RepID=UPI003C2C31EE